MEKLYISGGVPLVGELPVQGAKNSALPLFAAALLVKGKTVLHNCPDLTDVDAACKILNYLGCRISRTGNSVEVDASSVSRSDVPDDLMREMRSSVVFLGAIAARTHSAQVSFPGGCELGPRPIDLHLAGLRQLGLKINEEYGLLDCRLESKRFVGCDISFSFPSVGATENIMIAAATALGRTVITNAAQEPEIVALAEFLNLCGAKIYGAGKNTIVIDGVPELHGVEYRVIPVLDQAGCKLRADQHSVYLKAPLRLKAFKTIRTMPYPGFPTDAQAPVMTVAALASGTTMFVENVFENRYKHVGELTRMGAKIKVEGKVAVVEGVRALYGANVEATDLRGGASLVVAGLAASGITAVSKVFHIDRGYERIEKTLARLGARIHRES